MSDTDRQITDPPTRRHGPGLPHRATPVRAQGPRRAGDGAGHAGRPPVALAVATLVVATLVVGGCVAGGSSAAPSGPASASTPASSAPDGSSAGSSATTRTVTDWGRIWDALPRSFPVYPGAEPVPDASGPSTAHVTVPAATAAATEWWLHALTSAGYSGVGASRPLEDGSVVIDAAGPGECRVRVTVGPTGGTTTATILYGAACPFE